MAKLRTTLPTIALLALFGGFFTAANADTLQMEGSSAATEEGRSMRGMTQARVEATYGAPVSKKAPVGDPPISSWEYQNMVVFFEYDRVIHAVMKR